MNPLNYFDVRDVIFNELVGSAWLAFSIGLLAILFFAAKKRIPYQVILIFGVIWGAACFAIDTALLLIWALVVVVAGLILYFYIQRVMRRG